jgi:2-keto-3-deoxy-L-rhamnonate aldolase RhmA
MNPFRQALLDRQLTIGSWIQMAHPASAEILAQAGYDWLCVDCEHTEMQPAELASHARAMMPYGPVSLARVESSDLLAIRRALDMGVQGVVVPMIDTPQQAAQCVAAAKYPPQGVRGYAYHRGNAWGADFDHYARHANDEIAVVVMIESRMAVENINAIMAVEGVDAAFIGPYDMSGSYGCPGQTNSVVIQDACAQVVDACERAGKTAGLHVVIPTEEAISRAINDGFTMIAVGADIIYLRQAAREALASVHHYARQSKCDLVVNSIEKPVLKNVAANY